MQKEQLLKTNFVTEQDWDLTPLPVKDLVVQQKSRIEEQSITIEELEKELQQLKEKVNCNSRNSSIPPSTELIKPDQKKPVKKKKRKRGGQSGHVGHSRPFKTH